MYESEHTLFIRELIERSPDLPKKQKEGRAVWSDKLISPELYKGFSASRVAQSPYVYQNLPNVVEEQHSSSEAFTAAVQK